MVREKRKEVGRYRTPPAAADRAEMETEPFAIWGNDRPPHLLARAPSSVEGLPHS
jgi:hypothetical protein